MVNKEYYLVDPYKNNLLDYLFTCEQEGVKALSTFISIIYKIQDFKLNIDLSCFIDYPYGLSDKSVRMFESIKASQSKCKYINLSVNSSILKSGEWKHINKEISSIRKICNNTDMILRVMIEYHPYTVKQFAEVCKRFAGIGVDHVINSSGSSIDDPQDNILYAAYAAKKSKIDVIPCRYHFLDDHIDLMPDENIKSYMICVPKVYKYIE